MCTYFLTIDEYFDEFIEIFGLYQYKNFHFLIAVSLNLGLRNHQDQIIINLLYILNFYQNRFPF